MLGLPLERSVGFLPDPTFRVKPRRSINALESQRIPNGVQLNTGDLNVKVQFYADDIVRVVKWRTGGTPEKSSLVVIQTNVPDLNIRFQEDAGTITLASQNVTLRLSKSDGAIQFLTADNRNLLKEQGAPVITPVQIEV